MDSNDTCTTLLSLDSFENMTNFDTLDISKIHFIHYRIFIKYPVSKPCVGWSCVRTWGHMGWYGSFPHVISYLYLMELMDIHPLNIAQRSEQCTFDISQCHFRAAPKHPNVHPQASRLEVFWEFNVCARWFFCTNRIDVYVINCRFWRP